MNRVRSSLPHGLLVSLVAALTVWATMATWRPLTESAAEFIGPLGLCAVLVALSGGVLRWLGVPSTLIVLAQTLLLGALVLGIVTGSVLPTSETLELFGSAVRDGIRSTTRFQAPIPAEAASPAALFILLGVAAMLLADLVAVSRRLAAVTGVLLLAIYGVPVVLTTSGVQWWHFAILAAGFLSLLFLQQEDVIARWGHGVSGDESSSDPTAFGVRTGAVQTTALAIGGGTTAIAIVFSAFIPTFDLALLDGPGGGSGGDEISIDNPLVDMRRDLSRGLDLPLLRVTTDGQKPTYVRLSVLNRFNGEEWSTGVREVPSDQIAQGDMPALLGVSPSLDRTETQYEFSATSSLDSQWLPTTPLVTRIEASGDWRYDRSTMDFIAGDSSQTVAGLDWSLRGVTLDYDLESLDDAPSGVSQVGSDLVKVPANMPGTVSSLAQSVAGSEPTRFRKARALQDWFRTEFTYSLDDVDAVGSSELAAFLDESDRSGYCEQFAAAMAVMARTFDIPTRVAVGFLEPTEVDSRTWEFSAHDLHAWPELYFPGSGWVRFEPTPAGRTGQVPGYTLEALPAVEESVRPSAPRASEELPNRAQTPKGSEQDSAETDTDKSPVPVRGLLITFLALLALAALAFGPRLIRSRRRSVRLRDGSIESLWTELRDHCLDHGRPWPTGRSPRETGGRVRQWLGDPHSEGRPEGRSAQDPVATAALFRLVEALELSRYARPGTSVDRKDEWQRDLATCTTAISAGVSVRTARRAIWLPVSLTRRPEEPAIPVTSSSRSDSLDHAG